MIPATLAVTALTLPSVAASAPPSPDPIPAGFTQLFDDTGTIVVAVPNTWSDIETAPSVNEDGSPRPSIVASPDITSFLETFDTPGVIYAAFPFEVDPMTLVGLYGIVGGCQTLEVTTYVDAVFNGVVQVGSNCGASGMTWTMVVASPADQSFTALLQLLTAPDDLAMTTALSTFNSANPS